MKDVAPEEITDSFIPRPRPTVQAFPVGSEMILVDTESGMIHALNPSAALVWQCFDGEASLVEIVPDLADGFAAPVSAVHRDVLQMTRDVARVGLLEGVETSLPPVAPERRGLDLGNLVALEGLLQSDVPGVRRNLLINWSSGCGFCLQILPYLAALQPALEEAGVDLVLLDQSDPMVTKARLGHGGLNARVLPSGSAAGSGVSPFSGMGTPAAYLLDGEQRVAAPLAYGAGSVIELARSAAGVPQTSGREHETEGPPRFLPIAAGTCGPSAQASDASQWERTEPYAIGPYRVGIRANSPHSASVVSNALYDYRLTEGTAPDDFSVVLSGAGAPGRRPLNLLTVQGSIVARTRSPRRLMRALARHLSCLLEPKPGLVRLDAVGAVIDGQAVLLPPQTRLWLGRIQPDLARLGVSLVDEPFAHIDPGARHLVVSHPQIRIRSESLDGIGDPPPGPSETGEVADGSYPLVSWILPTHARDGLTPSSAMAGALASVVGEPSDIVWTVGPLTELLNGLEVLGVDCDGPEGIITAMRARR